MTQQAADTPESTPLHAAAHAANVDGGGDTTGAGGRSWHNRSFPIPPHVTGTPAPTPLCLQLVQLANRLSPTSSSLFSGNRSDPPLPSSPLVSRVSHTSPGGMRRKKGPQKGKKGGVAKGRRLITAPETTPLTGLHNLMQTPPSHNLSLTLGLVPAPTFSPLPPPKLTGRLGKMSGNPTVSTYQRSPRSDITGSRAGSASMSGAVPRRLGDTEDTEGGERQEHQRVCDPEQVHDLDRWSQSLSQSESNNRRHPHSPESTSMRPGGMGGEEGASPRKRSLKTRRRDSLEGVKGGGWYEYDADRQIGNGGGDHGGEHGGDITPQPANNV